MKKFNWKENVISSSQLKSSTQRGIRKTLLETMPALSDHIDTILPKKTPLILVKCKESVSLLQLDSLILFFCIRDGPWFPHLKLLHQYPDLLPRLQVDKGAIKFILQGLFHSILLKGAQIMAPGLTSQGARIPEHDIPKDIVVAIYAQGKEHCCAVGSLLVSLDEVRKTNKGPAIDNIHTIGDGLWKCIPE